MVNETNLTKKLETKWKEDRRNNKILLKQLGEANSQIKNMQDSLD